MKTSHLVIATAAALLVAVLVVLVNRPGASRIAEDPHLPTAEVTMQGEEPVQTQQGQPAPVAQVPTSNDMPQSNELNAVVPAKPSDLAKQPEDNSRRSSHAQRTSGLDPSFIPPIDNRSRAPLVLKAGDFDPDVRVFGDEHWANLYLRLPGKTSEEIDRISEQLGDIIFDGRLVKRGPSPGARLMRGGKNIGLAFYYSSKREADAVAEMLRTAHAEDHR